MKLYHISESEYAGLEDADEFGFQCSTPGCEAEHDFLLCNGCGSFWCEDCTLGPGFTYQQRLNPNYQPGHLEGCPNCTQIAESDEYEDLEDVDEFAPNEEEFQTVWELRTKGYRSPLVLSQAIERPEVYDICVDVNEQGYVDWDNISDGMVQDYAVMFGVRDLNRPDLREATLKRIWDYMLKHKDEWEIPMPTDSLFVPYLMGQDQWGPDDT